MKCFRNPQAGISGMESGRLIFQAIPRLEFQGTESEGRNPDVNFRIYLVLFC